MRHVLLPGAITAGTRGMQKPATMARPVPPAGGTLCVASGPIGTLPGAVDVAAIATAADHHLGAAAGTEEQPRRDRIVLIGPTGPQMTDAARAAILPRHACPGTVWCTVPKQNLAVGLRHRACHLSCGPSAVGTSQHNPALPLIIDTRGQDTTPSCAIPAADDTQASRQRRNGARFTRIPAAIDTWCRLYPWVTQSLWNHESNAKFCGLILAANAGTRCSRSPMTRRLTAR